MATPLMRTTLRPLYSAAGDAHPGLLIQRGYAEHDDGGGEDAPKTAHITRICNIPASDFYIRAFQRWRTATADELRFHSVKCALEARLLIGLTGGGMLETGCAISHTYGVPHIPGSSIKGAVNAAVRANAFGQEHGDVCNALFGSEPTAEHPQGLAGAIVFHDAWWVPDSAPLPLVQEVVTTHHPHYYGSDGATPATDLDSPVPNAQIAVQGSFLFVLEGPIAWMPLAEKMLLAAIGNAGLGSKTRGGYGYFRPCENEPGGETRCPWVDDTIAALRRANNAQEDDTLRGKGLAETWQALEDTDLKAQALADIRGRLEAKGWWEKPTGRSATRAKAIYVEAG